MPYPFALPTTSAFALGAAFTCPTHPSLLRTASTYRGVVRDTLKRHKRMPPEGQSANLALVVSSLLDYLPYLLTAADGLSGRHKEVRVSPVSVPTKAARDAPNGAQAEPLAHLEWRPVLTDALLPGKEPPRVRISLKGHSASAALDTEAAFVLAALGHAYTLQARAALHPLYITSSVQPARATAIAAATKLLLAAAAVYLFGATFIEASTIPSPPTAEIAPQTLRSLAALATAEATLLAVLKDDPYPAAVAQDRNENDREWMYKAPDLPKVRAHLFARLCLAAAEHAARATGGVAASPGISRVFIKYLQDLRHTSRAKACRFFAIDADLGGQTGTAIAWVHAALQELGEGNFSSPSGLGSSTEKNKLLDRFRRDRAEKREKKEDRRIERGANWGFDAGRLEETRVLTMLNTKWTKQNDTVNVQAVPPTAPLLSQMPSGREIHTVQPMDSPRLDTLVLEAMRAPPDPLDNLSDQVGDVALSSSEDEGGQADRQTVRTGSATPSPYY
ncbi:hypothetical protein SEPCBS119000_000158 [Sporothrix epigloea]|uniref:pH-response regulator protein palC n=1 Tax=Sporothrix epigloea TaxID=1892477 RepID=A0ABP0D3I1_9PEZI